MTEEDDRESVPPSEPTVPTIEPAAPEIESISRLVEPPTLPQGAPFDGWVRPPRVQRPMIGATLWCFGALFWAYLVVGEIVVWTAFPEALGILAVLIAFGLAWHRATSQLPQAPRWRWLLPGIVAFFSWVFTLLISSAAFSTGGRKEAELVALLLWAFAGASYALGRHLTAQQAVPMNPNARAGRIALWLIAGIATLMAGVNIISYA
ncbi:MAG TPA: hypothetical protein VER96_01035 [Polyangiaceae bacterium]|nr:hypothetical protein [Polyangiaceae bacterium]